MDEQYNESSQRIFGVAGRLMDKLERAVEELDAVVLTQREKVKTEAGETVTEFTQRLPRKKGLIDRGGLKQLTAVLKDLQDILLRDPQLDAREREAKLLRLERELDSQMDSEGITVILSGEAEEYAG